MLDKVHLLAWLWALELAGAAAEEVWCPDLRYAALPACLQLRAGLEEPGGKLPGFMRVCDCIVQVRDECAWVGGWLHTALPWPGPRPPAPGSVHSVFWTDEEGAVHEDGPRNCCRTFKPCYVLQVEGATAEKARFTGMVMEKISGKGVCC